MQILIFILNSTDSTVIESSSRFQIFNNGDLVISNIQEKDAGAYKCIRSNEAGSVSGEAFLGVLGNEVVICESETFTHHKFPNISSHSHNAAARGLNSSAWLNSVSTMQSL
jgi:hypothetical protein